MNEWLDDDEEFEPIVWWGGKEISINNMTPKELYLYDLHKFGKEVADANLKQIYDWADEWGWVPKVED